MKEELFKAVICNAIIALTLTCSPRLSASESQSADQSIKGIDPKNLPFDKVIAVDTDYTTSIVYDRATEGDMCFITCNNYNGVTSKWSNYYVDLQPFENFCMFITGCSSQYPIPSAEVRLTVNETSWTLKMTNTKENRYYLPLDARKAISQGAESITIEIAGVKMPQYKIGRKNISLIAEVVNQADERQDLTESNTKTQGVEERLLELKRLKEKNLISADEYEKAREKVINGI